MFDYGRYTPYILSAYGIAIVVLGALVGWSILRAIRARKKLDAIETPANNTGKAP
jgi:heme exporter protein CcmD